MHGKTKIVLFTQRMRTTFVFDFQISLGMYVKVISYLYSFCNMFYILVRSACITYFLHGI